MQHEHLPSNSPRVNLRAGRRSYRTSMLAVARAEAQGAAADDPLIRAVWLRLADEIAGRLAARTRTLSQAARSWPR
jgi:hypothetical protein